MTFAVNTNAAPASLSQFTQAVVYFFRESGNATPIMFGDAYLENVGFDARIVFVPEVAGSVDAGTVMGVAGSILHGCSVHVRAAESGDDMTRYDAATALQSKAMSAIRRAGSGRLEFTEYKPSSPTKVDAFGAQVTFAFTWRVDVLLDPEIYAVPPLTAAVYDTYFPDAPGATPASVNLLPTVSPTS